LKSSHEKFAPWLTLLARLALGGVLLVAGGLKVSKPTESANATAAYKILPTDLAHLAGYALPWLEVVIGLLLIFGIMVRYAAVAGGLIMIVFIGAIISVWARGMVIDCGCFGGGGVLDPSLAASARRTYLIEILRDLGLALCALYLYFFPSGKLGIEKTSSEEQ